MAKAAKAKARPQPSGGCAVVAVYDGTRRPFPVPGSGVLITVRDGNQKSQSRDFHHLAEVPFEGLPLFDNFGDNYTVLASAKSYKDAGIFPVRLAPACSASSNSC